MELLLFGYCRLCPSSCLCKCPLCAHMPLKLLTVTYCKQWRRLCPVLLSPRAFFFSSFLDLSVRPLWDIVFVQASPLYPHKQYVILEDGQRMFSHTHTHRASPHNTSWQLSRRITMTSQHWETIWTLSTRLNCGGRFSEDGDSWWKRSPTPISAKSLNAAFPKLWLKTNHQRGFLTLSASVSRAESQLITSVIHPAKITWICCDFICSIFLNVQICCSSLSAVIVKWIHFSLGHLGQTKQDIFRHDLRLWEVVMGIFPFLTTSHW